MKTETQIYDVDYFINKFEQIPEEKIIVGRLQDGHGSHCANGWCGAHNFLLEQPVEVKMLRALFEDVPLHSIASGATVKNYWDNHCYSAKVVMINNGQITEYQQPTPKQRILAALYDIKRLQQEAAVTTDPGVAQAVSELVEQKEEVTV